MQDGKEREAPKTVWGCFMRLYVIHPMTHRLIIEPDGGARSFMTFIPVRVEPPPNWGVCIGLMLRYITTDTKNGGYEPLFYFGRMNGYFQMTIDLFGVQIPIWPLREMKEKLCRLLG